MLVRCSLGAVALLVTAITCHAQVQDPSKLPDWSGQWHNRAGIQWDQTKPLGRGQQAPLTPEYLKVFEASMADQAAGGQGNDPPSRCAPFGLPRIMSVIFPMASPCNRFTRSSPEQLKSL